MKVIIQENEAVVLRQEPDQVVIISQSGPPGSGGGGGGVTDGDKGDLVVTGTGTIWTIKAPLLAAAGTGTLAAHVAAPDPHPQYALVTAVGAAIATREPTITAGSVGQYWRGDKTWQTLNAAAVGLANVNNTSDAAKPVSTAQQTALDLKANLNSPTFTGTVSGITAAMVGLGNVNNTSDAAKPVSTATQTALNLKADLNSPTFTGTVSGITRAMVGLGNVDNTSDANKPVSTAQATAINAREPSITAGGVGQYWRGDKTWQTLDKAAVGLSNVDNTADNAKPLFTNSVRGLVPGSGGGTTNFLRADGTWAAPPGGGGGGSPGGSDRQVQFNNAGAFDGSSQLQIGSDGGAALAIGAFDSALPSVEAGLVKLFTKSRAGRSLLGVMGPSGLDTALQAHLGLNTVRTVKTNFGSTGPAVSNFAVTVAVGTHSPGAYANTNLFQRTARSLYLSAATAASQCGLRTTNSSTQGYLRFGRDGFFVIVRFGVVLTVADRQLFVGIQPNTTSTVTGNPSAATNIVGLAMDSTDTNLQLMHNDGSGSATKIDLGANFPNPVVNQDFYELRLYQAPGSFDIGWYVENLHNGNKANGVITTDRPAVDQQGNVSVVLSNGATAAAVQIGLSSIYVETDF